MSAKKFLEENDPKVKHSVALTKAITELRKTEGGEAWCYEQRLSTFSGVPLIYIQKFRVLPEFKDHVVETPRQNKRQSKFAWFVDKKLAAEMRAKLKVTLL